MRALLLTVLLAQANPPAPAPPPTQAAARQPARAPLSGEDAEVVKQLALLERVELLENLELFEGGPKDGDEPPPQTRSH